MSDNEEREVAADEAALPETANEEQLVVVDAEPVAEEDPEEEPAKTAYIEFVGEEPYGTQFVSEHTVSRRDLKTAWDVTTPKDLKWTKADGGPNRGRMLVPVADMSLEAAEGFAKDPMFKRVEL